MTVAYWCIFIVVFIPFIMALYAKFRAGFTPTDNHNPREFLSKISGVSARANAAQQNSYEIFPVFAAAVIIAHLTGNASQSTIDTWAILFVISRIIFCLCYIFDKALLRSLVWGFGLLCIIVLFISAA